MYTVITFGGGSEDYYQERKRVTQKFLFGMIMNHLLTIYKEMYLQWWLQHHHLSPAPRHDWSLLLILFVVVPVFSVTHAKNETEI